MPFAPLTVITGENGTGKSNLYRALRLLCDCSQGQVVNALASQGGLPSAIWAGPENLSRDMQEGMVPTQGTSRKGPVRLRFGLEVGDSQALAQAVDDAFPESYLFIDAPEPGRLTIALQHPGMLRPLLCTEWSDGPLQYVLLIAALLTPRPPALMVLNEPESSLHPDVLPALARLIIRVSVDSQVWVVSHSQRLVNCLDEHQSCQSLHLSKPFGRTEVEGIRELDLPPWRWP